MLKIRYNTLQTKLPVWHQPEEILVTDRDGREVEFVRMNDVHIDCLGPAKQEHQLGDCDVEEDGEAREHDEQPEQSV